MLKTPLERVELPDRQPAPGEIPVTVPACGVCHDLRAGRFHCADSVR